MKLCSGIERPNATLVGYKKLNADDNNKPIVELGTFSPRPPADPAPSLSPTRSAVGGSLPELRSASSLKHDLLRRNTMLAEFGRSDVTSDDVRRRQTIAADTAAEVNGSGSDVTIANLHLPDSVATKLSLVDTDDDVSFKTAPLPDDETTKTASVDDESLRRHLIANMMHAHSEPTLVQLSDVTLEEKDGSVQETGEQQQKQQESEASTSSNTTQQQEHTVVTSQPQTHHQHQVSGKNEVKRTDSVKSSSTDGQADDSRSSGRSENTGGHCTVMELLKEEFAMGLHEDDDGANHKTPSNSTGSGLGMRKNMQRLTSRGSMTSSNSSPEFVVRKRRLVSPVQDEMIT